MYTVCPRRLVHSYIASIPCKLDNTSLTYSAYTELKILKPIKRCNPLKVHWWTYPQSTCASFRKQTFHEFIIIMLMISWLRGILVQVSELKKKQKILFFSVYGYIILFNLTFYMINYSEVIQFGLLVKSWRVKTL